METSTLIFAAIIPIFLVISAGFWRVASVG
jgi:hypothetical protein